MGVTDIHAYWQARPLSAREYAEQLRSYVAGLAELHHAFAEMYVVNDDLVSTEKLEPSLDNLLGLTMNAQPEGWAYMSPEGTDGPLSADSVTRNGFLNTLVSTLEDGADCMSIDTSMGSTDSYMTCHVGLRVRGADAVRSDFLRDLFKFTVLQWQPFFAFLDLAPESSACAHPLDDIPIGWLTYLANDKASTGAPQGVIAEPYCDGALLEICVGDVASPDAGFKERLLRLRESLRNAGLLVDPLN